MRRGKFGSLSCRSFRDTPPGLRLNKMAGLLTCGSRPFLPLPGTKVAPGVNAGWLAAHSCGGSRGLGARWRHRTAFPFQPGIDLSRTPSRGRIGARMGWANRFAGASLGIPDQALTPDKWRHLQPGTRGSRTAACGRDFPPRLPVSCEMRPDRSRVQSAGRTGPDELPQLRGSAPSG
jgi:hypothetical protein